MLIKDIKDIMIKELPKIVETDEDVRQFILDLSSKQFADKKETESRFEILLDELRRDREVQIKKWDEQNKRWEEQGEKWDEQNKKWDEQNKRWEEQNKRWEEQDKKWEDNQRVINDMLEELKLMNRRFDVVEKKHNSSIGALGARWGIFSEESFRNGLRAILEESFHVEVIKINEWDDQGVVFGRPDQVEMDIIIKNTHLIICEIKSSISKADVYTFEKKIRFYEDRHKRQCDRMLIISPMVEPKAKTVADNLGIEVYSHSYDVSAE